MKKLLQNPILKGVIKSLPIIGEIQTNIDNENKAEKGKLDVQELIQGLIRLVLLVAIIKGVLSIEEAGEVIDAIK